MKLRQNGLKPILRPATNQDAQSISELVFGILREYGLLPDPASTDADLKNVEGHYAKNGGMFDLLEIEGEIIGSVGLYPVNEKTCELRKMYLAKKYRGRGFGKLLLNHALMKAKQLGFCRVNLETASVLKEAIGLYLSHGFRPCQPEHLSPRCDCSYTLEI